ncbi:O-antigen ligase family protein [Mucilaginibacter glaciei]|uniref:O-antigen ligase family protein n=1 Tax=Mucilaginibacter glaciei TaxID=2772109 RepID=A0A926S0L4_9SPHI|nr:O-antigen ligase family protein [Mucilaginibacter glaciei]MBD1391857.1 O-antigen ligase family protein [Mucilaginibacter glaciei]
MLNNPARSGLKLFFNKKDLFARLTPFNLILLLLPIAVFIGVVVAKGGIIAAGGFLVLFVGIPMVLGIVAYPKFGIAVFIFVSFFLNYVGEVVPEDVPLGIMLDAITYLLIFGFFLKKKYDSSWDYFKNPVSYLVLAWLGYNLLEAINPSSPSILAWVYTVRTVGFLILTYFIFVYHIRSVEYIRFLFKLWLLLALIAAMSGFQQENIGLLPFEQKWYYSDPEKLSFLFIMGHLRKVGIFPDPVTYSYNLVVAAVMCIVFAMGDITRVKKILLWMAVPFFLLTMLYSGTRAAYVLPPAALALLAILKFNRKVLVFVLFAAAFLGVLIVMPTGNPLIKRFQSAFKPNDDPSYLVRVENQRRIKPFILSHPIGGGLGSVGVWGRKFAPNSMLAKFPPDSGYVRVAVEMGWIGLFLFCTLMFVILKTGINNYFLIKDPELKNYCLAMVLVIFIFNVGNSPQQALVQYPSNILFYLAAALLVVTYRLDKEKQAQQINNGELKN